MSWMRMICLCVGALLIACSSMPAKTPVQAPPSPDAILSKPDLIVNPPNPSISDEEWREKYLAEANAKQATQFLAILSSAKLLDPGADLAGTGQMGKSQVFRLPKVSGMQMLAVGHEMSKQVLVEVYEQGVPKRYNFWALYNNRGYFLLRTDLYDTYLRLTPLVSEAHYALRLVALDVKGNLDDAHRYPGRGVEGGMRMGRVYSDRGQALANVRISVQSLYANPPFTAETLSDAEGRFSFDLLPYLTPLRIEASLKGYTTRVQERMLQDNSEDFDIYFGSGKVDPEDGWGEAGPALSQKPEIISVNPDHGASISDRSPDFTIRFSKPIKPESFEDDFQILALRQAQVDPIISLPENFYGSGEKLRRLLALRGDFIFGKEAFQLTWNATYTEVRLRLKLGHALSFNSDFQDDRYFQVSFERSDSNLRAQDGLSRSKAYFNVQGYGYMLPRYVFKLQK